MGAPAKEDVVDEGIFQECQKDENETAHQVDVDGLDIRNLGKGLTEMSIDGSHGQHSCYSWFVGKKINELFL